MSSLGEAVLSLIGDATQLKKDIDAAKSEVGTKMQAIGSELSAAGRTMTTRVTLPILGIAGASVKMASDLEESMNAVNVVFGEAGDAIHEYGETAATSVGLSRSEFNQLSAEMGAMLNNVGIPLGEVAGETINLAERSADMASIFNTDVSQAFNAIQSAIKGEFNPLETFGVKLNAAMIEAKALEMGLGDLEGNVNDAAKAQAALALVYEQTDQYAGDFQNTADGLANSSKILTAQVKDEAAALGQDLLPIALEVVNVVRDLVGRFKELTPEQKKVIMVVLGLAAAIGPLLMMIGGMVSGIGGIITVVSAAGPVLAAIAAVLTGPVGIAIAAVVAAVGLLYLAWKNNFLGIQDTFQTVWSAIQSVWKAVQAALEGDWYAFGEYLREAWDTLWGLIEERISGAWDALVQIATDIVEGIKLAFQIDWGSVGLNIVQGIANGITNALSWIRNAARQAARAALDAAKGFLGIRSPSKVMEMEVGWQMGLGVARGWENSLAALRDSMSLSMGRMVPAIAGAGMAGAGGQGSMGGGTQVVIKIDTMIGDARWVDELASKIKPVLDMEDQRRGG